MMREGYFYFIPAAGENREENKALGYISISKAPGRSAYSVQCSLNRNLLKPRGVPEIYFSPAPHADSQSISIGKVRAVSGTSRLFIDSYISYDAAEDLDSDIYAVVSCSGRTLCYSMINKKSVETGPDPYEAPISAAKQTNPHNDLGGRAFDPFGTTNDMYKWYIYDIFGNNTVNNVDSVKNMQQIDKLFKHYNINYSVFARLSEGIENSAFLKMAHSSVQIALHLLRGEYSDAQTGRRFTIIGLPGWNPTYGRSVKQRVRQPQIHHSISGASAIRGCSRWMSAVNRPRFAYNSSYNGYWLYYFDSESGLPVKAVMKE